MININKLQLSNYNNNLSISPVINDPRNMTLSTQWCNIIRVNNSHDLSAKYQDICQSHHDDNKWILMINPENDSLEQLSNLGKINPAKILKVNANKVNVSLEHIKKTLLKGTCSAMILSDAHYNQAELKQIAQCAALGQTQCILLQKTNSKPPKQLH
jgi:cell division inhibitor SulA